METYKKSPVNCTIVIINVIVFAIVEITGGSNDVQHMVDFGAAMAPLIAQQHEYYRLFTSMFLHFGMAHLVNNMLVLYFVGGYLERAMGKIRYLILYIAGGLGASYFSYLAKLSADADEYLVASAGASGAIFAVIGAMIYVLLRNRGQLEDLTVGKLIFMAALSLYLGFTSSGVDNIAHVGGFLCGVVLAILLYRKKKLLAEWGGPR